VIGCLLDLWQKCSIKIECQKISQSSKTKHKQCQLIKRQLFTALQRSVTKNKISSELSEVPFPINGASRYGLTDGWSLLPNSVGKNYRFISLSGKKTY
jgi:hypothetical protein